MTGAWGRRARPGRPGRPGRPDRGVLPARLGRHLDRVWRREVVARDRRLLAALRARAGQPVVSTAAGALAVELEVGGHPGIGAPLRLRLAPVHPAAAAAVGAAVGAGPVVLAGAVHVGRGGPWALHLRPAGGGAPLALLAGAVTAAPGGGGPDRTPGGVPALASW